MKKKEEIEYLDKNQDEESSMYLFFLHGYGANAQDLSGFHTLKLPIPCRWIFPNAPLKLESPYNIFHGRAWFPLKVNTTNNQLYTNEKSLHYLEKHCERLLQFISSFNLTADQIILGGFSQGAIMALNAALRMTPPPRALVLMSGAFTPSEILNRDKHIFSTHGRFFQCHGKTDPLLSYSESKKIHNFLQTLQWTGKFVPFEGGHEIPHAVLLQIQEFISHTLS